MATSTTDLSTLSVKELHDYRLQLRQSLLCPGGDGVYDDEDRALYENKIEEIKTILGPDYDSGR